MRVFLTVDETNPLRPVPELHINGYVARLSEQELDNLFLDIQFVRGAMSEGRGLYFARLADKYKEVQQCAA